MHDGDHTADCNHIPDAHMGLQCSTETLYSTYEILQTC